MIAPETHSDSFVDAPSVDHLNGEWSSTATTFTGGEYILVRGVGIGMEAVNDSFDDGFDTRIWTENGSGRIAAANNSVTMTVSTEDDTAWLESNDAFDKVDVSVSVSHTTPLYGNRDDDELAQSWLGLKASDNFARIYLVQRGDGINIARVLIEYGTKTTVDLSYSITSFIDVSLRLLWWEGRVRAYLNGSRLGEFSWPVPTATVEMGVETEANDTIPNFTARFKDHERRPIILFGHEPAETFRQHTNTYAFVEAPTQLFTAEYPVTVSTTVGEYSLIPDAEYEYPSRSLTQRFTYGEV